MKPAAKIRSFVPPAGPLVVKHLKQVAMPDLVAFCVDEAEPVWRRRRLLVFLRGRLPTGLRPEIWTLLKNEELRIDALGVLVWAGPDRALLSWMQQQATRGPLAVRPETWRAALLHGRQRLGDRSAELELTGDVPNPWTGVSKPTAGQEVLDRVRRRWVEGHDITCFLDTPHRHHARLVYEALKGGLADLHVLHGLRTPKNTPETQAWATLLLRHLGETVDDDVDPIPAKGLPADVREAIVNEYAERDLHTDPRWLLECGTKTYDAREASQRLCLALEESGLGPTGLTPGAASYGIGQASFVDLTFRDGSLRLSTLGPFVHSEDAAMNAEIVVNRLEGFRWINPSLARLRVGGLPVYMFGTVQDRTVHELLFFWHDSA